MFKRIILAFRNELTKAIATRFLYLGLILSMALPWFCSLGFNQITSSRDLTGFIYLANSIQVAVTSLIPIFILIYGSILIASETAYGRYRDILSRPLKRSEFLIAKIMIGFLYLTVLLMANLFAGIITGALRYGFAPLRENGEIIVSQGRFILALFRSYILILFPLVSIFSFGFFVSTLSRSLVGALGFALGIFVGMEPFKFLIPVGDHYLEYYLFSSYLDKPFVIMNDLAMGIDVRWWTPEIQRCVGFSLFYTVLFLCLSFILFKRRDLNG
ncbi:ABC transporter permease [Candidatus Sumerlaeota bacterium]|nr:ABC transporter permease [Candidatus Sumerlaeota bacterium]